MALSDAIESFKGHLETLPDRQKPKEILRKRPLPLYRAHGITDPKKLVAQLVSDRLVASREMAMGYLYERIMEEVCAAIKLTNSEKKEWKGIDFRKETNDETLLINLKSSRATSNADISDATQRNLVAAAKHEQDKQSKRASSGDDNPLSKVERKIVPMRAIARGVSSPETIKTVNQVDIRIVVGDTLWKRLGAGANFTRKIEAALGAQPVDTKVVADAEEALRQKLLSELASNGCIQKDGSLNWPAVLKAFPDQ
ncbi:hypothetical protein GKN94_11375 [Candidatus Lucifugimonas marina]|uniref:PmeII family type II restriction endonuclease n=1 Tax=Candidatus Lucifugimonas marina TaxID=3038979 RepID=UPI00279E6A7B|nr:hypothetical protein GKN94_11375 [SAR202 cluster bacterium JH545]